MNRTLLGMLFSVLISVPALAQDDQAWDDDGWGDDNWAEEAEARDCQWGLAEINLF